MNFLSEEFSDEPGAPSLRKLAPCLPKPNCVPTSPHPPNLTSDPPKGHCGHNQNHLETHTGEKYSNIAMYPLCNNMQLLLHSFRRQNISIQLLHEMSSSLSHNGIDGQSIQNSFSFYTCTHNKGVGSTPCLR